MKVLVVNEFGRLGEGDHNHRDTAPVELGFKFFHLAEVGLARQSGKMAKKDQEQVLLKMIRESYPLAVQIEQRQLIEGNFFH